jgi:hypothetical protein
MKRPRRHSGISLCVAALGWQACTTGDEGPGGLRTRTVVEAPPPARPEAAGPDADLPEPSEPSEPPRIEDIRAVVPGANLPPEVLLQRANNNLDLVDHDGRLFLAFRTAPNHFASASTRLYVVSTEDELSWRFEGEFFEGTDLREPRLLSLNGELFLYYAVLGTDRLAFEPQGMKRSIYAGPGRWSEPEWFGGEGFIPWRVKVLPDEPGVAYLVAYIGGENLYEVDGEAVVVHWLRTTDGRTFEPAAPDAPDAPVVLRGGTSETDFTRLPDGTVIAVARNEAGGRRGRLRLEDLPGGGGLAGGLAVRGRRPAFRLAARLRARGAGISHRPAQRHPVGGVRSRPRRPAPRGASGALRGGLLEQTETVRSVGHRRRRPDRDVHPRPAVEG